MCVCGGERMVRLVFACIFECLIDYCWTLNILPPCSSAPLCSHAPVWSKLAASGEWGIRSLWKWRWRKRHNTQHIYSVYRQQWVPAYRIFPSLSFNIKNNKSCGKELDAGAQDSLQSLPHIIICHSLSEVRVSLQPFSESDVWYHFDAWQAHTHKHTLSWTWTTPLTGFFEDGDVVTLLWVPLDSRQKTGNGQYNSKQPDTNQTDFHINNMLCFWVMQSENLFWRQWLTALQRNQRSIVKEKWV